MVVVVGRNSKRCSPPPRRLWLPSHARVPDTFSHTRRDDKRERDVVVVFSSSFFCQGYMCFTRDKAKNRIARARANRAKQLQTL